MKLIATGQASENTSQSADEVERVLSLGEWCFAPHKDIVVPPYYHGQHSREAPPTPARPVVDELVLAGGVWGPKNIGPQAPTYYAQGMRQRLFMQYGGAFGTPHSVRIVNRTVQNER